MIYLFLVDQVGLLMPLLWIVYNVQVCRGVPCGVWVDMGWMMDELKFSCMVNEGCVCD